MLTYLTTVLFILTLLEALSRFLPRYMTHYKCVIYNLLLYNYYCASCLDRGSYADVEAESDGVLSAKVLPALWHQQGQVCSCECIPLQLPAGWPIICLHATGAGTNVPAKPWSHHGRPARDHGGEGVATSYVKVCHYSATAIGYCQRLALDFWTTYNRGSILSQ